MCFVAWHEGQIIHATWVAFGHAWIAYLNREITLAPNEVYSYESFTVPAFRGQNVYGACLSYEQQVLKRAGYCRIVLAIMPENKAAFRPVEKAGFRPIGVIGYLRLGPWRCNFTHLWPGVRPLGQLSDPSGADYWDNVAQRMPTKAHYLDPFLCEMKKRAHLALIARWDAMPS